MTYESFAVKNDSESLLEPWTWGHKRAVLWLQLNDLEDVIEPLSTRFRLDGPTLMTLNEHQLDFLSAHTNYPRLLGRLNSIQQLYPRQRLPADNSCNVILRLLTHVDEMDEEVSTNDIKHDPTQYGQSFQPFPGSILESATNNRAAIESARSEAGMQPPNEFRNSQSSNALFGISQFPNYGLQRSRYLHATTSKYTIQRLILALCICLFGFVFCSYMVVLADERRPPRDLYPPLPDIFLDNVGRVKWATPASEVTIVLMTMLFLALILVRFDRLIILKRCCLMLGTLYTFRGMTIYCTSLTVVGDHLHCYPQTINFTSVSGRFHRLVAALSSQGLQINGAQACGDYIFSGHTCILVVLTHFITYYMPRRCCLLVLGLWTVTTFAIICILAAHFHYTVDVVLATAIASYLFTYYHALCNCPGMFESHVRSKFLVCLPMFYVFENRDTCSIDGTHLCPKKSNVMVEVGTTPEGRDCCGLWYPRVLPRWLRHCYRRLLLSVSDVRRVPQGTDADPCVRTQETQDCQKTRGVEVV